MKFSVAQLRVIELMKSGIGFYFNAVTSYQPYTQGSYGMKSNMINGKTMNKLECLGIVQKEKINQGGIYKYELTELGKTIQI